MVLDQLKPQEESTRTVSNLFLDVVVEQPKPKEESIAASNFVGISELQKTDRHNLLVNDIFRQISLSKLINRSTRFLNLSFYYY